MLQAPISTGPIKDSLFSIVGRWIVDGWRTIDMDRLTSREIRDVLRTDTDVFEQAILACLYDAKRLRKYVPRSYEEDRNGARLREAEDQASFVNLGKSGWLGSESSHRLRFLTSFFVGDKKRRMGNVYECTHFLETASRAINFGADLPYFKENNISSKEARDILAFAGYAHDLSEDFGREFPFLSPQFIVEHCWRGKPEHKDLLIYLLEQLTDPPELEGKAHKAERLALQVKRANEDPTGIVGAIRLADKLSKLQRDIASHELDPERYPAEKVLSSAEARLPYVEQMTISKKIPHYRDAIEEFKERVRSPQSPSFAVNLRQWGGSIAAVLAL